MLEKYEVCRGLFHGFDWSRWIDGHRARSGCRCCRRRRSTSSAQEDGKARLLAGRHATLSQAFALAVPHDEALAHPRRRRLLPGGARGARQGARPASARPTRSWTTPIRQIVSRAVVSDEVIDIFAAAGLQEAGHLDPLRRVPGRGARHAAAEPRGRAAAEAAQGRDQDAVAAQRRPGALVRRDAGAVAPQVPEPRHRDGAGDRGADRSSRRRCARPDARGETLGLTEDELAFYDALEINDSAVKVLGDETLRDDRPRTGRRRCASNVTIDWTVRENVRAQLRVLVKRILRKYGYPPDKQEKATQTVLEQAEVLSAVWTSS